MCRSFTCNTSSPEASDAFRSSIKTYRVRAEFSVYHIQLISAFSQRSKNDQTLSVCKRIKKKRTLKFSSFSFHRLLTRLNNFTCVTFQYKNNEHMKNREEPDFSNLTKTWNYLFLVQRKDIHKQEHYNQYRLLFPKSHPGYGKITHPNIREGQAN